MEDRVTILALNYSFSSIGSNKYKLRINRIHVCRRTIRCTELVLTFLHRVKVIVLMPVWNQEQVETFTFFNLEAELILPRNKVTTATNL